MLHYDKTLENEACIFKPMGTLVLSLHRNNDYLPKISEIPILPNNGYKTKPDKIEVCRMKKSQLEKVANFTVKNNHGKIKFLKEVNLLNLNVE